MSSARHEKIAFYDRYGANDRFFIPFLGLEWLVKYDYS
jgi:hypothetical protein